MLPHTELYLLFTEQGHSSLANYPQRVVSTEG